MTLTIRIAGSLILTSMVLLPTVGSATRSAPKVFPPFKAPRAFDRSGLQSVPMFSRPLSFRLPARFRKDASASFIEGGVAWVDGRRRVLQINGLWGPSSFGLGDRSTLGYSECVDTIAGIAYRFATSYSSRDSMYNVAVAPLDVGSGRSWAYTEALVGTSPNRRDQQLFLAIFKQITGR